MNDFSPSHQAAKKRPDILNKVNAREADRLERTLGWWFKLTMPPRPEVNASFVRREADRRARLLSIIGLFYLTFLLLVLGPSFYATTASLYSDAISIVLILCALAANKMGKGLLGSALVVLTFQSGLVLSILSSSPLDLNNIPLYDIFVIGELIAVSVLPVRGVFLLAILDSLFIIGDLLYQPHSQALAAILHQQFVLVVARPVIIQISVAAVLALWVSSTTRANERANRAEMVATVEHALAEQHAIAEQEKQELETSIQQLIQAHVDATNAQVNARIPYPSAKVLWPLVGVLNSLWTRLQQSQHNEQVLQRLKEAITFYTETIRQATSTPQKPLSLKQSGTDLDVLMLFVKRLHEASLGVGALRRRGGDN